MIAYQIISDPKLRHCYKKAETLYCKLGTAALENIKSKLPRRETELIFIECLLCARPYTLGALQVFYHFMTLMLL